MKAVGPYAFLLATRHVIVDPVAKIAPPAITPLKPLTLADGQPHILRFNAAAFAIQPTALSNVIAARFDKSDEATGLLKVDVAEKLASPLIPTRIT
jgi:hypothetical protein